MKGKLWIIPAVFGLLLFAAILAYNKPITNVAQVAEAPKYHATVCVWKNGELVGCKHNVLFNSGKNLIKTILGDSGTGGPVKVIALCDASLGCAEPTAAGTETYNEFSSCGLAPAAGSYTSNGVGNWSITKTFTATCDNLKTNVTRLKNSGGTYFAGASFTTVTLQTNDQLTVTWTIWVS